MAQQELIISSWAEIPQGGDSLSSVHLRKSDSEAPWSFSFETIRGNLFRTTFTHTTHPLSLHGNASLPKVDLSDVRPSIQGSGRSKNFRSGDIEATVTWDHTPHVSLKWAGSSEYLHQDLPHRSYVVDGPGVAHYSLYKKRTLHTGLGEKAAPMDLSGRSFVMSATDCFGYDVYRTDPMYKHIPLLINATPNGCFGIFSTSHGRGSWSIGAEMDGLWGPFKVYRQAYGGLEEYLIVSKTLQEVVKTYADVVGYPKLVPRWGFGYLGGGMKYSMLDEPRACDALMGFADKLREHDIPCSGFQMSSGYTVAETEPKTRNVFTWNKHRFPDPEQFIKDYHARGIRLIMNVKPYVLGSHPEYQNLVEARAMFTDPQTKGSAVARLWSAGGGESGEGGHIDFTSKSGFQWWYDGIQSLRKIGVDCIWNDNNEYTIPNDDWECALTYNSTNFSTGTTHEDKSIGKWGRALHTELMAQSSHAALSDLDSNLRPFILTRSATPGTMRFANTTWSGDNVTSWEGMKGSVSLSLNSGLSLLQVSGHDIGGFEGPQPSPELLIRWVQLGIYSPKFAINCYKTSPEDNTVGDVIEPWMYPSITPLIRDAIKRRYEILPYIYSLALESHLFATPAMRWVGWGYEHDAEVWKAPLKDGETQFWFGDSLMVAGVFEEGAESAKVYLPKNTDDEQDRYFLNLSASEPQYLRSGQWHQIPSPYLTSFVPVLAKIGGAVPIGKPWATRADGETEAEWPGLPADVWRGVEIYPSPMNNNKDLDDGKAEDEQGQGQKKLKVFNSTWYEDDGTSRFPEIVAFDLSYHISSASTSSISPALLPVSASDSDSGLELEGSDNDNDLVIVGGRGQQHTLQREAIVVDVKIRNVVRRESADDDPAEAVEDKWRPEPTGKMEGNSMYRPIWYEKTKELDIVLPKGDKRAVLVESGDEKGSQYEPLKYKGMDAKRRRVWGLKL